MNKHMLAKAFLALKSMYFNIREFKGKQVENILRNCMHHMRDMA